MKTLTHALGILALGILFHGQEATARPYGYAYSPGGQLFTFDLTNPGNVVPIGTATAGANTRGIDTRPGTATIYAVDVLTGTSQVQVFTIDPNTGVRTAVGAAIPASGTAGDTNPYSINLAATAFGLDFNPTTLQGDASSRFRLVTSDDTNFRFNSATGTVTNVDGNLGYTGGTPATVTVTAGAYTNSDTERTSGMVTPTTLYYIDTENNNLVLSASANTGQFATVGALGVDLTTVASFDIFTSGGNNFAYVVGSVDGTVYSLYTVDLATGALTSSGTFPTGFEPTLGFTLVDLAAPAVPSRATGFGYNAAGQLFSFPLGNPAAATAIGAGGQTDVKGIDFLPGSNTLYSVAVGTSNSQLASVDIDSGAVTAIGSGFANTNTVPGTYTINPASQFGFDFNPTTVQVDGSIRIRFVDSVGTNLRLNSTTGGVAAVDGNLNIASVLETGVSGAAYTNSDTARTGATLPGTRLYYLDADDDVLLTSPSANTGTSTVVGPLGVDVAANTSFDILSFDGVNVGYIVVNAGPGYTLHTVDLQTGAASASIGTFPAGFTPVGGFATTVLPPLDTERPTLITQGPSRIRVGIGRASYRLHGKAFDNVAVAGVFVKREGGSFSPAVGTNPWRKDMRLRRGTNVFTIVARDTSGNESAPDRVVVFRKSPRRR